MSHTRYILAILGTGILSLCGWFLVLLRLDPYSSTSLALMLFFISLFFALASFFTVLGYYFRIFLYKNEIYSSHIFVSLREGILFALFICSALVFQILRVLTWWNLLILLCAIFLLEAYFVSRAQNR